MLLLDYLNVIIKVQQLNIQSLSKGWYVWQLVARTEGKPQNELFEENLQQAFHQEKY